MNEERSAGSPPHGRRSLGWAGADAIAEAKAEALRALDAIADALPNVVRIPLETNAIVPPSRGRLRTMLRRYVPKHTWRLVTFLSKAESCLSRP